MNINNQIFFTLYDLAHRFIFFDKLVVFTAEYLPYLVILVASIFLLWHHEVFFLKDVSGSLIKKTFSQIILSIRAKWAEIVLVFFSGVLAWCLSQVLKIIIHIPRPFIAFSNVVPLVRETSYSFPSGHATFFMALAFALYFSHKKVGYIFIFLALLIGLARIIAGVHFPLDILGGFVLGILTAYLVKFFYKIIKKEPNVFKGS